MPEEKSYVIPIKKKHTKMVWQEVSFLDLMSFMTVTGRIAA